MASTSDNHASSSSSPPQRQKPSASRLMLSMKRSLTQSVPKKRAPEYSVSSPFQFHVSVSLDWKQKSGMHSTFEETNATSPPQQFREADPASSRPTIQQIAMGLHTSRTPHLRPLASSSYTFSQRHTAPHSSNLYEHIHHKTTSLILPPPPTRSSMKMSATSSSGSPAISPPFSSASATSTLASLTPSSSHSPRSFARFKSRMARFLPSSRSASLPSSLISSPLSSPRSSSLQTKKAVRFTTEIVIDGD
jgi:hypothetical protein